MLRFRMNRGKLKLAAIMLILFSVNALAQTLDYQGISTPVIAILCGLWDGFKLIAGALATLVFIVAGVQWIYNADDPSKRKAAKEIMVHVIVGLIIVGISNEMAVTVSSTFAACSPTPTT